MDHGYTDQRSTGWARRLTSGVRRVACEVMLKMPGGKAHRLKLAPQLKIKPPEALQYQGYVDELSIGHAAGWVRDENNAAARFEVEAVLPGAGGEVVLARARANSFSPVLDALGIGDGRYAFDCRFTRPVLQADSARIFVRPVGSTHRLEMAPALRTEFALIHRLDVELGGREGGMAEETFDAILRLSPYVADGGIRLMGLERQTLNFAARVPAAAARSVSVEADLAARTPPILFEWIAKSGIHSIAMAIASFEPEVFGRLRPTGGLKFFREQFTALTNAVTRAIPYFPSVPRLHYEVVVSSDNLSEMPSLVARLVTEGPVWQVEITRGKDLGEPQWAWLETALVAYPKSQVIRRDYNSPEQLHMKARWDGALSFAAGGKVFGNINDMADPIDVISASIQKAPNPA